MSRTDFSMFEKYIELAYNLNEAMDRLGLTRDMIEHLRDKIKLSKSIPQYIIDNQLLIFLNSCNGDVDMTISKLERYYDMKRSMPEFFDNRDLASSDIQHCLDSLIYVSLPMTDDCYVILHKLRSYEPKDYWFDPGVKTFIMKTEALAFHEGPRKGSGIIFVDDLEGASLWHLFRPSINSIRRGLKFLQEGSPFDVKAVHVLNTPTFLDKILAIVKPFLRTELRNKIYFHSSSKDLESFYKEHIPKSNLPSDYGGDLGSIEELHTKQRKAFMEMRGYFLTEEKQKNFEYDRFAAEWNECRKK